GMLGEVADTVRDAPQLGLRDEVCVAEHDRAPLVAAPGLKPSFTPIPEFPAIERDLNFVLDETVSWADLSAAAQDAAGPLCESVAFVDQFRGSQLGAGKKSYVLRLSFRAGDRTLMGEEVDAAVGPVVAACEKVCRANLRG
ncbi:MAG: phenylalanine--tRNA ligase subunit beta, partial [Planctomycetota bacterium]